MEKQESVQRHRLAKNFNKRMRKELEFIYCLACLCWNFLFYCISKVGVGMVLKSGISYAVKADALSLKHSD